MTFLHKLRCMFVLVLTTVFYATNRIRLYCGYLLLEWKQGLG